MIEEIKIPRDEFEAQQRRDRLDIEQDPLINRDQIEIDQLIYKYGAKPKGYVNVSEYVEKNAFGENVSLQDKQYNYDTLKAIKEIEVFGVKGGKPGGSVYMKEQFALDKTHPQFSNILDQIGKQVDVKIDQNLQIQ